MVEKVSPILRPYTYPNQDTRFPSWAMDGVSPAIGGMRVPSAQRRGIAVPFAAKRILRTRRNWLTLLVDFSRSPKSRKGNSFGK